MDGTTNWGWGNSEAVAYIMHIVVYPTLRAAYRKIVIAVTMFLKIFTGRGKEQIWGLLTLLCISEFRIQKWFNEDATNTHPYSKLIAVKMLNVIPTIVSKIASH